MIQHPLVAKVKQLQQKLTVKLQDHQLLRIVVLSLIGATGLGGMGLPTSHKIHTFHAALAQEKQRRTLIEEHNTIESKLEKYRTRLPKQPSLEWWIDYLLNAIREANLKVAEYKPILLKGEYTRAGELQGILLKFEIRGPYQNTLNLVGWLEAQKPIVRLVMLDMKEENGLKTSLTVGVLTEASKLSKQAGSTQQPASKTAPQEPPPSKESEDQPDAA